jgi:hypothetical protein
MLIKDVPRWCGPTKTRCGRTLAGILAILVSGCAPSVSSENEAQAICRAWWRTLPSYSGSCDMQTFEEGALNAETLYAVCSDYIPTPVQNLRK